MSTWGATGAVVGQATDDHTRCAGCGGALAAGPSAEEVVCTNPTCPAGGRFGACRTCRRWSEPHSGPSRGCWNDACSASPRRERCPSCGGRTIFSVRAARRCASLACPSNQGSRGACEVCGSLSRLSTTEGSICVSAACGAAWRRLVACAACARTTFDPLEMRCLSPGCALGGGEVRACPSCRKNALAREASGAGWRCVAPGCGHVERERVSAVQRGAQDELKNVVDRYLPLAGKTQNFRGDRIIAEPAPAAAPSPHAAGSGNGGAYGGHGGAPADPYGAPPPAASPAPSPRLPAPTPPPAASPTSRFDPFEGRAPSARPPEGARGAARGLDPFEGKTAFGIQAVRESGEPREPASERGPRPFERPHADADRALGGDRSAATLPPLPGARGERATSSFDRGPFGATPPPPSFGASPAPPPFGAPSPAAPPPFGAPSPPAPPPYGTPSPPAPPPYGTSPPPPAFGVSSPAPAPLFGGPAAYSYPGRGNPSPTPPAEGSAPPTPFGAPPAPPPFAPPPGAGPSPFGPSSPGASPFAPSSPPPAPSPFAPQAASPFAPAARPAFGAPPPAPRMGTVPALPALPAPDAGGAPGAPPAPTAAPPAEGMAASQNVGALAAGANIEDALDFLLEEFLAPEVSRMPAPCHLVIGLPGAGKTTYLAMLGEMLHHRDERYHFPFRDLDVRRLDLDAALDAIRRRTGPAGVRWSSRALAPRVRDLVFDFARKVYAGFIARQQWAPATRRDESYFLVSELSRERRPLARLVTLEASGEEYREMLRALGTRNPAATRPSIRCLKRLLDLAEGLVVLVDPSYERNDELYHTLFLALKEDLEPRARNALKKAVRERLERATEQSADQHRLERARDYQRRFDAWLKRVHDARAEIEARLVGLERTLVHEDAVRRLTDADLHALGELEKQIEEIRSEEIDYARRQRDKASAEGGEHQALGEFYRRMVRFALSNPEAMLDMARTSMGPPPSRPTEENTADIAAATDAILHAAKLPAGFLRFTAEELNEVEPERRFVRLRHVALVVTKTDLYPVIHPPELFPKQRLPVTWQHLRMVDAYLRLVGGGIRYYNASATGYAVYQDGMFSPGKEMTLTPINVVEPLFHMLGLSGG